MFTKFWCTKKNFLDDLDLPCTSEKKKKLNKGISLQEVVDAIKLMKAGKAAGPDGIPIDIYKKFKEKLIRISSILDMLLEAFKSKALITQIQKLFVKFWQED